MTDPRALILLLSLVLIGADESGARNPRPEGPPQGSSLRPSRAQLAARARAVRLREAIARSGEQDRFALLVGGEEARKRLAEEEAARRAALRARCQSPYVQDLLRPFLDLGHWQPVRWRRGAVTLDLRPISYRRLVEIGALEDSVRGQRVLYWVAVNGHDELRLRWPFRSRPWHHAPGHLREVQELLLELGPTLVELGMLSE